jgi:Prealbumin-like fold domain
VKVLPLAIAITLVILIACAPPTREPIYVVQGRAMAGPTCPFLPPPMQPGQCDERPVAEAVLVITDSSGHEVTRLTTGADGSFSTELAVGRYTLTPQQVAGLIGGAPPIDFTVASTGAPPLLDVEYDTGIR